MATNTQRGILLTLGSAVFNGSTYVITKAVLGFINVETMLVLWFFWGNLIFLSFFLLAKKLKAILKEFSGNIKKLALLGAINSLSAILWSYGVLYGNPASVAFIFRLEAVLAIILGLILLKEKLSKMASGGILLAIFGAFIMLYERSELLELGNLIMLGAAFISALLLFLTKTYISSIGALTLAFSRTLFLFLFLTIYALSAGRFQLGFQVNVLGLTFLAALVGAFLGFVLFFKSLSFYELSRAVSVRSIEPFFSAIMALIILGVSLSVKQWVGGLIIVSGVIILNYERKN